MSRVLLLLKTYGKIYLGSISKRSNKKEYLSGGALVGVVSLLFIIIFATTAITTINQFLLLDPPQPIYALYVLSSTGLMFMLLTVVLKGTNFKKSNDHDLLLSLPFTKFEIVLSKVLKDYLFDFLSLLLIMMPSYVCYFVMVKSAGVNIIINGIIVIILITFFSNACSIFLSTIISKFTRKLKHKDLIRTLISVFVTVGFIAIYYVINVSMTSSVNFVEKYINFLPLKWIVEFIANGNMICFGYLTLVCILPFIAATLLLVHDFNHPQSSYYSSNKPLKFDEAKVVKTLFKNEIGRYFRSTIYVINTIIGSLFTLLFGFLILGFGIDRITGMISTLVPNADMYLKHLDVIIIIMFMLVSAMTITTSASISIEGKYFWILKAHPINEKHVFNSKLLLNIIVGGIPVFISGVVLSIVLGFKYLPFLIILPLLSLCASASLGLINNLKYYKLDWKDEQEVVKQGMAVLVSLGTALLPTLVVFIGYFVCSLFMNPIVYLVIAVVIMILFNYLLYRYLMTKGIEKFRNIVD